MPKPLPLAKDFTYKLPEGYTMDETLRGKLDKLVDEFGLCNTGAQMFVDLHVELMEDYAKRLEEAAKQQTAEYAPETQPKGE